MPLHGEDLARSIEGCIWLINMSCVSLWILDLEESHKTIQATSCKKIGGMWAELDISNITIVASEGCSARLESLEILGSKDYDLTFATPCDCTVLVIDRNSVIVTLIADRNIFELLVLVGGVPLQVVDNVFTGSSNDHSGCSLSSFDHLFKLLLIMIRSEMHSIHVDSQIECNRLNLTNLSI